MELMACTHEGGRYLGWGNPGDLFIDNALERWKRSAVCEDFELGVRKRIRREAATYKAF